MLKVKSQKENDKSQPFKWTENKFKINDTQQQQKIYQKGLDEFNSALNINITESEGEILKITRIKDKICKQVD